MEPCCTEHLMKIVKPFIETYHVFFRFFFLHEKPMVFCELFVYPNSWVTEAGYFAGGKNTSNPTQETARLTHLITK